MSQGDILIFNHKLVMAQDQTQAQGQESQLLCRQDLI